MYFFYIDDSGNRDPGRQSTRPDGSIFVKDHVNVLTAVMLFERAWAAFEAELTDHKFRLRSALHKSIGLQTDISGFRRKWSQAGMTRIELTCSTRLTSTFSGNGAFLKLVFYP